MSRPALIRQADVKRIAQAAKAAGCVAEVEIDGMVIRLRPDDGKAGASPEPKPRERIKL